MTAGYEKYKEFDPELEQSVLGLVLANENSFGKLYGMLKEDSFHLPEHRKVFSTIKKMWEDGMSIDLVSVSRRMYDNGVLEIGHSNTGYYLTQLVGSVGIYDDSKAVQWSIMLRELSAKRILKEAKHISDSGDSHEQASRIKELLSKAFDLKVNNDWVDTSKAAIQLTTYMDRVLNEGLKGVSTGFSKIDNENGGFQGGQLIVLGARPSMGKSALASKISLTAAEQGHKVGVISLEMQTKDLFGRMVSYDSGIGYKDIELNRLTDDQRQTVVYSTNKLAGYPIFFSDQTKVNINDIRAKSEKLRSLHGIDFLVIDYLQLVDETDTKRNREQGVAQISRGLKQMAMNMDIPILALSQLNRGSENRSNKRPTMADLRESGAVEQDADIVMLLHRDWHAGILVNEEGESTEFEADLICPKWRNGAPVNMKIFFHPTTMKFSEEEQSRYKQIF